MRLFGFILLCVLAAHSCWGQVKLGVGDDNMESQNSAVNLQQLYYKEIKGVVLDSLTRTPIPSALVSILAPGMSVRHTSTDKNGKFRFSEAYRLIRKDLKIEITCLGYRIFTAYPEGNMAILDLGKILLSEDTQQIDAITVRARMNFFTIKGDTIVFNPKAVRTLEGDMAADILRKMPGVTVDGSNVSIMGENVARTYVNGRPIYGTSGNTAINYVKANEVAGIRAYDEIDVKEYERSGKIRKQKALNIITFDLFTQNIVGEAFLSYGADMEKNETGKLQHRYMGGGGFKFFNEQQQLAVDAMTDNTGIERNTYSSPGMPLSDSRPTGYKRKTLAGFSYQHNRPMSQVVITLPNGTKTTQNKMGSSMKVQYNYTNNFSRELTVSNKEYFPTTDYLSRLESDTSRTRTLSKQHNLRLEYMGQNWLDVLSAQADLSEEIDSDSQITRNTTDGQTVNFARSSNDHDQKRINASLESRFTPLRKGKHSLQDHFMIQYSNGDTHRWRVDTLKSTPRQLSLNIPGSDNNLNLRNDLSYTYRLKNGKQITLGAKSQYRHGRTKSYAVDSFTGLIDTTLTRDYLINQFDQSADITWEHRTDKMFSYNITVSPIWTHIGRDEYFPEYLPENRTFFAPEFSMGLMWMGAMGKMINFRYQTFANAPSIDQLRNQLDTENPLWLQVGNPDLKQEYKHSFVLSMNFSNFMKQRMFNINLMADIVQNQQVLQQTYYPEAEYAPRYNYTIQPGATLNSWGNVNGAYQISVNSNYSAPAHFLKSLFKTVIKLAYGKSPTSVNNRIDFVRGFSSEATLGLTTNFSSKFEAILNTRTGYRNSHNAERDRDHNVVEQLNFSFRYNPHRSIFINSSYEFFYNRTSLAPSSTIRNHIWDATVGRRLLKDNIGSISVTVYDILNRNKNLTTVMNAEYFTQIWRQVMCRYFTVNLSIKLNHKK